MIKVLSIYETETVIKFWLNKGYTVVFSLVPVAKKVIAKKAA
jgi:hypothetical protein